jgi:PPOX class probable F420-dependent enzyme
MPASLDDVRRLVRAETGLATLAVARPDGSVHVSLINAGVLSHPLTGLDVIGVVVRGDTLKLRLLRARPRASMHWRHGWDWVAAEGPAELIGPDDALPGFDPDLLPALLRAVFTGAGGTHDDWDAYDRAMADERRCALLVRPDRIYGNRQ